MSVESYCPVCQRSLYVADDDESPVCPVCSSVLVGPMHSEDESEPTETTSTGVTD